MYRNRGRGHRTSFRNQFSLSYRVDSRNQTQVVIPLSTKPSCQPCYILFKIHCAQKDPDESI